MKALVMAVSAVLVLSVSAAVQTTKPKTDDLDKLLAPIALYPDALLGPMLLSAGNPATIGALSEWLRSHDKLKGTELQDAAKASGFAESYVALVLFPQVVRQDGGAARLDDEGRRRRSPPTAPPCSPAFSGCARRRRTPAS